MENNLLLKTVCARIEDNIRFELRQVEELVKIAEKSYPMLHHRFETISKYLFLAITELRLLLEGKPLEE